MGKRGPRERAEAMSSRRRPRLDLTDGVRSVDRHPDPDPDPDPGQGAGRVPPPAAHPGGKSNAEALGGLLRGYSDDDDDDDDDDDEDEDDDHDPRGAGSNVAPKMGEKEPLGNDGPAEVRHPWKRLHDAARAHDYYWNQETGEVSWTLPAEEDDGVRGGDGEEEDAERRGTRGTTGGDEAAKHHASLLENGGDDAAGALATSLLRRVSAVPGLQTALADVPPLVRLALELDWLRAVRWTVGGAGEASCAAKRERLREIEDALPGVIEAFAASATVTDLPSTRMDDACRPIVESGGGTGSVGDERERPGGAPAQLPGGGGRSEEAPEVALEASRVEGGSGARAAEPTEREALRAKVRAGLAAKKGKIAGVGRGAVSEPRAVSEPALPPPPLPGGEELPPPPPPSPPGSDEGVAQCRTRAETRPARRHVIASGPVTAVKIDPDDPPTNTGLLRVGEGPPKVPALSRVISRPVSSTELERWNAVRAERDAEEARAAAAHQGGATDPAAVAARRRLEIEAWKDEQLRRGGAETNPNFAPTVGNWRERAAAARRRREREAHEGRAGERRVDAAGGGEGEGRFETSAAEGGRRSAVAAAAAAGIDIAALSAGLPEGWRAFYDVGSRDVYYGNLATGETSWDPPPPPR